MDKTFYFHDWTKYLYNKLMRSFNETFIVPEEFVFHDHVKGILDTIVFFYIQI